MTVAEEEQPRRRRRRRRRGGVAGGPPGGTADASQWDWRRFPVLFAFALGALAMAILTAAMPDAFPVLFIGALFAAAFGVAHLMVRRTIRRRKQ